MAGLGKVACKYMEYHTKHQILVDHFTLDSDFQFFSDGLKQKDK